MSDGMEGGAAWLQKVAFRSLGVAVVMSVVAVVAIIVAVIALKYEPSPKYFAVTQDLRVMELTPLDQPAVSDDGMLQYAVRTVSQTLSLDYVNYKQQLAAVEPFYSLDAYQQMLAGLRQQNGPLDEIINDRLVVTAVASRAPVVAAKGVVDGKMTWKISFPITVTYNANRGVANVRTLNTTVVVQRVPVTENVVGAVIIQLVFQEQQ